MYGVPGTTDFQNEENCTMRTTLWNCVVVGAAVALSAGIAAGGVGDLSHTTTAPPALDVSAGTITMKTPEV